MARGNTTEEIHITQYEQEINIQYRHFLKTGTRKWNKKEQDVEQN